MLNRKIKLFTSCAFFAVSLLALSGAGAFRGTMEGEGTASIQCENWMRGSQEIDVSADVIEPDHVDLSIDGTLLGSQSIIPDIPGVITADPTSYIINSGTLVSGDINSLYATDGDYFSVEGKHRGHWAPKFRANILVDFYILGSPSEFTFTFSSLLTSDPNVDLFVYDGTEKVLLSSGTSSPFIASGLLTIDHIPGMYIYRFAIEASDSHPFSIQIDKLVLEYTEIAKPTFFLADFDLDSTTFADGEHELLAEIYTSGGSIQTSKTVNIDNTLPTFQNVMFSGLLEPGQPLTITADVIETNIEFVFVSYSIGATEYVINQGHTLSVDITCSLPAGDHQINLVAIDLAGNYGTYVLVLEIVEPIVIIPDPSYILTYTSFVQYPDPLVIELDCIDVTQVDIFVETDLVFSTTSTSHVHQEIFIEPDIEKTIRVDVHGELGLLGSSSFTSKILTNVVPPLVSVSYQIEDAGADRLVRVLVETSVETTVMIEINGIEYILEDILSVDEGYIIGPAEALVTVSVSEGGEDIFFQETTIPEESIPEEPPVDYTWIYYVAIGGLATTLIGVLYYKRS